MRSFILATSLAASLFAGPAGGGEDASGAPVSDVSFARLLAAKRWEEAEAEARARMRASPGDAEAGADLAQVLLLSKQREHYDEAIALLEAAVAARPDEPHHYFLLGQLYGERARGAGLGALSWARRSKAAFSRAVELAPASFEYIYALNEYMLEAPFIAGGSAARARKTAEEFSVVDPDGGAMLRARIAIVNREFREALRILRPLQRRDVVLYDATRRMLLGQAGMGLLESGAAGEALPVFEDVTAEFPNNAEGQLGLGRARLATGDVAGAVAALERSLEIARRVETLYHLGVAHQAAGNADEARAHLAEAAQSAKGAMAEDIRRRLAQLAG